MKDKLKLWSKKIINDFKMLTRVCGFFLATKWLLAIVINIRKIFQEHNLLSADFAMGKGPFECKLRESKALLYGDCVFSGLREIWARDVYLQGGLMKIGNNALVLDLGDNMGNFTLLALGHNDGVNVIAIEPNSKLVNKLKESLKVNSWLNRVTICQNFIGGVTNIQSELLKTPEHSETTFINPDELIQKYNIKKIDFLKCDIEGSEFELLKQGSNLLKITEQIAIEIHDFAGDRNQLINLFKQEGFEILNIIDDTEYALCCARRIHNEI